MPSVEPEKTEQSRYQASYQLVQYTPDGGAGANLTKEHSSSHLHSYCGSIEWKADRLMITSRACSAGPWSLASRILYGLDQCLPRHPANSKACSTSCVG